MTVTAPACAPADRLSGAERCAHPAFGTVFTEHTVTRTWSADRGWADGVVQPYGPVPADPATVGLHHGQVVF